MKGSEKQIKWAEDIKAKRLNEIEDAYQSAVQNDQYQMNDLKYVTAIESGYATAKEWFEAKEDATYFIDLRNLTTFQILDDSEVFDYGKAKGRKRVGKGIYALERALSDLRLG